MFNKICGEIKMKIELKATGDNGSGKTRCLNKIKLCLESIGLKVNFSSEDEHKLIVDREFSESSCEWCEGK